MTHADPTPDRECIRHVRIGEIKTASEGILKVTLGSCVGIALINRRTGVCGLAHCFLPVAPSGCQSDNARYTDRAIVNLLNKVAPDPIPRSELHAFLTGGGKLLVNEASSRAQIGQLNIETARATLRDLRIRYTEIELGGNEGCSAILDCGNCAFASEKIKLPPAGEKEGSWN